MKQYLKNLFLAITGNNPFQAELEEAKKQLQRSAENMSAMRDQLYSVLDKWEHEAKMLKESQKRETGLQQLTENLRERIADKDRIIVELEEELNKK